MRRQRSSFNLGLYLIFAAFILSFVFFEVLDLDGFEFKTLTPPVRPAWRQAAPEEDDDGMRRVVTLPRALARLNTARPDGALGGRAWSRQWSDHSSPEGRRTYRI